MLRQMWVGVALMAVTIASAGAPAPPTQSAVVQDQPAQPGTAQLPDFTGTWRLDRARSDSPERTGHGGAPEGAHGQLGGGPPQGPGAHGRHSGFGSHPSDGGWPGEGMRRARMPEVVHIEQDSHSLQLADTTGTVLQVIHFAWDLTESSAQAAKSDEPAGAWVGDRFQVQRSRGNDVEVTDSYWLEDDGRTLKVRTVIESHGSTPSGIHTRVYTRVGSS